MRIVRFDIIKALIDREKRQSPSRGQTLDRRIAAWREEVDRARWTGCNDLKALFGRADFVGGGRVVFDVCGNNYRLVVQFNYSAGVAVVRFAGTHAEYDRIDVTKV